MTIVKAFPGALEDRGLDGELLGKGYNSFFQQLKSRADNVTLGRPAVSPGTSPGRSSSTHSNESEGQYGSFSFYLEYLPEHVRRALKAKRPLPPRERRDLVRCVVEQLTTMCARPRRDMLRDAAITVVQAFPDALEDRGLDGRVLGRGYDSFFQQLECRAENINRGRIKGVVAPDVQGCSKKPVKNSFGCVNWQPMRNSEPPEDIDDKIEFLKREGKKGLEEIDVPLCDDYMEETYPEQRTFINADPAPCISKVKDQWPMLFHRPFFYKHGNKLLAKDVKAIFDQKVSTYAPPLVQYLESIPKKEVMYTLMIMQEVTKKGNTKAVEEAVPPLLCAYFKEDERHLFRVLEEGTNITDILHELPITPTIVALGSIFQKKCFVACEQQILFTEPVDFSEAACLLLLSYYVFNLAYADPVSTTLEFLQREMFAINPLRGSKCGNGRKSRTSVSTEMGFVFCLIILQNGNRRKLKLATGAYAELLKELTGIVDVDHENTLIQMFDTDLDDFVDLVPGDEIPNKAKLRVISRSASTLCNAAVATAVQNVATTCPRNLPATKPALVNEQEEVSLQACEAGIQEVGGDAVETSEPVLIIEIPRETVTCSDAAVQTVPVGGNGRTGRMAANLTRIQDALFEMQPYSIGNGMQTDNAAISPAATQDKKTI
ncbi:hypothetical protein MTO96_007414 [Rhipicephalus appendiculatus]